MAWYNQTADIISETLASQRTHIPLLAVAGASLTLGALLPSIFSRQDPGERTLRSPRALLSAEENREHPLPNDVLPGARDVSTPYGSIRVYEWGPEDGQKVLFVHGITTPCLALGGVAHGLVDRGCRVMLFDLFGRGYSDCPSDIPQDERLFSTQIFLALNSSPISWTGAGSGKFCLVGYSLGGGIAASFASFFPQLLSSLVLLAPSGLLRDSQISLQTRLLYSRGLMPDWLLTFLVGRRLNAGPLTTPKPNRDDKINAGNALTEELPSQGAAATQILSRTHPQVTIPGAVRWQVNNHTGFVHAFMSSMRFGPILQQRQWDTWSHLGKFLTSQRGLTQEEQRRNGLPSDKVFVLCGIHDPIILKDQLSPDASKALEENVQFKYFDAGHEFPSTKYDEVAEHIWEGLH